MKTMTSQNLLTFTANTQQNICFCHHLTVIIITLCFALNWPVL